VLGVVAFGRRADAEGLAMGTMLNECCAAVCDMLHCGIVRRRFSI
jgi:hypothetical protein